MDTTHCHPFSRDTIGSDKGHFWVLNPCFVKHWRLSAQSPVSVSSNTSVRQVLQYLPQKHRQTPEKDTFYNVIGYKQKPSVSFLVRILVENSVTQK